MSAPDPVRVVQDHLARAVAERTGLDPAQVPVDRPIAELGLGSRQLMELAAGLAELTGEAPDPSILFDHPTIAGLASALAEPKRAAATMPDGPRAPVVTDEIAIVSMAGRFPGAEDPEGLWRLLDAGRSAIGEVPPGRWNTAGLHDPDPDALGRAYSLRGGFLPGVDRFDAAFFGISPREAARMDPQQRLLLQTAWELVERAGIVPATLHGSATGVYIGLYDSGYLAGAGLDQLDGHAGTGAAASVASGRIAYTFGLHGPAVTVDTACSSSLVALHLAARALAAGECDLAMAGGATLMLSPRAHVEFSRLRGLSPSGVCRPFSADADGVVWSEGCGLVLLKRLPDARRDGDRVLAVLAGSAVNQDGRSQGLSAPNGLAQQRVVRAALAAAALSPDDIDYVEAHGTGTALGDPVEANALAAVFGPGRPAGRPLLVGSLKSNLGHLQAAAGIAGVVKTVLALRQGRLAASLHASRPTGHVRWDGSGLRLCDGPVPWLPGDRVRHAGVSAFGISGTNAHVILREAPPDPVPDPVDSTGGVLLALSARTPAALRGQAARLLAALEAEAPPELPAVAGALAHRRAHLEHRAVVADLDGLRALARDETGPAVVGPQRVRPPGRIAFVFPGQGAQWVGMGRDLLGTSPRFADELERCDAALRAHTGWSVVAVLRGDPGAPAPERVDVVQPALFAVMVALAAVWRAHGVRPAAVVGHSQGELAAACVAGALSLGDAAAVVALRSRALAGLGGGMAVIGLPADEVERHCERLGGIGVAAVNSGRSTVVAGEVAALEALLAELDARQVFARRLDVGYASHSPLVEPLRERLAAELDGVIASPAAVTWYSSVSAEPVAEELPAAYWYRNLREPVRFAATVERMIADGCTCFVELSPHPSLLTAIRTIAEDVTVVGSLRRGEDGLACLRRAAAELHVHGWPVDWRRLAPDRGPVELPTYAWDAQRHWIDPGPRTGGPWPFAPAQHPLLGVEVRSVDGTRWTFRAELSPGTASWLPHHRVFGRVVVSATTLAELCRAALAAARPQRPAYLSGLMLPVALILPDDGAVEVSVEVAAEPGAPPEITVHGRPRGADAWTLHACATAADASRLDGLPAAPPSWPEDADRDAQTYDRLAAAGLGYGPAFRGVESAVRTAGDEVLARLRLPEAVREDADSYPAHPALLDAALQAAALLPGDDRVMLPVAIGHYALAPGAGPSLTAAVRRTSHTAGEATLDVTLWDADGLPAGLLDRVRLRAADPAGHRAAAAARAARHLYEVAWTPVTPPPGAGIGETRVRCWPAVPADAGSARELAAAGLAELQQLVTDPPSRVVWVTRGAIATAAEDVPGLAQSVLWGLARTARAEHPDLALHLLDLDPAATDHAEAPPEVLRAVVASGEPELALRGGIVLAPRLVPARTGPNPPEIPTDGTVLVTGGLGAVGRQLARWLAHSGVPRLLLTSRRGPDDPRAAAARTELEALGAEVEIAACDAADARAVAALLTVPLRGVVHCAGVLADAALAEQSPERLAEVMRPKVDGALNLDRLTEGHPVTLFVLVSSAAAVAGSPGQANYAAANALLDQLAHRRRARGRPAVAIGFGAWSGGGLATGHADLAGMARRGYGVLTPEQGRELAALAVRRGPAHLLAWPLDLARLRESDRPPLWRALLPVRDTGRLAERLRRLPEPARRERILAIVREEAARVLGLPGAAGMKADEPLRDLGLDSLTAVDLRNRIAARIGRRLPATLLFDHPTPAGLAAHLAAGTRPVPDPQPQRADADEPIAVVGMACRLPGGVDSPDDLWDLLAAGRDAIGPFPADRWDVAALFDPDPDAAGKTYAREGGFLDAIDGFDAGFFGIAPREAAAMDPQQRLLLELAWEALERAGIVPDRLAGSDTGVYVGMFGSEYLSGSRLEQLDGYVGTGSALSVASGRLAYALRLHGPAVTVDTACSSSLVAVHLAAQALRGGECDLALAGGATLMVTPQTFVEFSRLRGLSPTGRCRSFAADADGAVWAEGGALVVLKRLADARRDGDEVLAVLAGSAVNQDGRSQGLAAPNGPAQERVVRRALRRSGLAPADIDYVEAHGTGTTLGDPIEANALAGVFGATRPAGRPLLLGSLKSNLGHLQAAAGVAGLIKVVQALRHGALPRTLHAERPSPHVDWATAGLRLLHEPADWPATGRIRRAGVSAFGISGTNAHVVVEEPPRDQPAPPPPGPAGRALFVLSARGDAALRAQAARLAARVAADPATPLPAVAATLARHRSHFERRAALLAADRAELLAGLDALGRCAPAEPVTGKVAFVVPGHGGQWPGMALALLAESAPFAAELDRLERALGVGVVDALRGGPEALTGPEILQPVLFAVNAALAAAWRGLGVTPDAVAGHSLGEIAAAYVAGALSADDAATVVAGRAAAVAPLLGRGGMLAVELTPAELDEHLADFPGRLFVGAVNAGRATAVAGDTAALAALKQRVGGRELSTPFASHSPLMAPVRDDLLARLAGLRGGPAATALYSTVLAEPVGGDALDAGYWYRNLSEPVRFAATVRRMLEDGYRYFIELSPHPSLAAAIESVAADAGIAAVTIGSLRRDDGGRDVLLRGLTQLYRSGHTPDWTALFPGADRVDLPTYAFARERHWLAPAPAAARPAGASPLIGTHVQASDEPGRHLFETVVDLRDPAFAYLADHRVRGEIWLPAAALLDMALAAAGGPAVQLTDVRFERPLRLDPDAPARLQLALRLGEDGTGTFTIAAATPGWVRHAHGRVSAPADPVAEVPPVDGAATDVAAVYSGLSALGIDYGPAFRNLREARRTATTARARLEPVPAGGHRLHPAVLDAAFHTAALPADAPRGRAFVPAAVDRIRLDRPGATAAWAECRLRGVDGDRATVDVRLLDEHDEPIASIDGLRLEALSPLDGALFEVRWRPAPHPQEPPGSGPWLLLADDTGTADELARRLGPGPHVLARRGTAFAALAPGRYELDPLDPAHLARLLAEAFPAEPPDRIIHLYSLDAPPVDSPGTAARAAELCCLSLLHLVRAVADRPGRAPRLFVVVRGSQPAGGAVPRPEQALAWGLGAAIDQEYPHLGTTLVDLPADGGDDALWTQLVHADDERLVALRETGRLVPRLAPARIPAAAWPLSPGAACLVTGGLGGLGRIVAERLVRRGTRRLALLGRREPTAEARRWLAGLRARGVTVHVARADVADRAQLAAALAGVRTALGPIAAVVHAAGVLDDATVADLTDERVRRVLAPKVLGTALLAELVPEAGRLVLFASAAGLFGSAGQAPYSAANAFLDAYAHHLGSAGRAALSLDWGAWAGVGLVAGSGVRADAVRRSGLAAFTPEEGGELFERVLPADRHQLAPLALDWEALATDPDAARARPLLRELAPAPGAGADRLAPILAAATPRERRARVEAYVVQRVAEITDGDVAPGAALKELGLDSLMMVRLRNAFARDLGVRLTGAEVYAAADIAGLAVLLDAAFAAAGPGLAPPAAVTGEVVPEHEFRPAPRDVIRLLRSASPGMPPAAHAIGIAARLHRPVDRSRLAAAVDRMAARHAALRTAIVAGDGTRLRIDREPAGPLLRWTGTDSPADPGQHLRALLEPPFDLERTPLWRFECVNERLLLIGAHHAVSDLASLLLAAAELDRELAGDVLPGTTTNRDADLLRPAEEDPGSWREAFQGCARLDLGPDRPARTFRTGSVEVPIPAELLRKVAARAGALAITPAAFCLGVLSLLLARRQRRDRFVLAVPVDTRLHADAADALGFFGVPVPVPVACPPGDTIRDVLRRTDARLEHVLTRGASLSGALAALVGQGLHRDGAPLIEVYFNYVRFPGPPLTNLEVLPAGTGYSDLDLMVTLLPDAGRLRLDHSLDVLDPAATARLGEEYLRLLGEIAEQSGTTVALAATFALGNLPLLCRAALDGPEPVEVAEAPYHHVLAALRDPAGVLADPAAQARIVLVRGADLERFGPLDDAALDDLRGQFPAAVRDAAGSGRPPLVVGFLPAARPDDRLERWAGAVADELAGIPGVAALRPADWTRDHAVAEVFDERTDELAHLPFTAPYQAAVALTLAEVVKAARRPAPKVIAVDGDETLWGGAAGEIGPDAVDLGGPRARLAERLLQWRAAGTLLMLVSNNDEATVRAVLDRADSTLRAEHFAVVSATWGPKAARLDAAAGSLNLGLDAFLFLDDNPVEIAAVRAARPEVLAVTCPPAAGIDAFLRRLWPFVPVAATAEDARRAAFYDQERARDADRERAGFEAFLAGLDLHVDVRPLAETDAVRAAQLVQRTNQFTLRARSADGGDLDRWRAQGEVWTASARDRFGDYGQVGLLALAEDGDQVDVRAWLLSCRALGRGVEERLLAWLADRAEALGHAKVRLSAQRTPRNTPARRLLVALGGGAVDDEVLEVTTTPDQLRAFRSWRP